MIFYEFLSPVQQMYCVHNLFENSVGLDQDSTIGQIVIAPSLLDQNFQDPS